MSRHTTTLLCALAMSAFWPAAPAIAETTTTIQESTTTTTPRVAPRRVVRKRPATTTSTNTTAITVQTTPRKILDEDTLRKISNTLCTEGFKAYVGGDRKNVCHGMATAPDLAYSCVWKKNGPAAYSPADHGPCSLDFVERRGSVTMTKDLYKSSPPLSYGVEAQCCYRAAHDTATSTSTSTNY